MRHSFPPLRSLFPMVVLLALPLNGWAQKPVTIKGETSVKAYRLVKLQADDVPPKAGILWRVYPPLGVDRANTSKGHLQFVAPPGEYSVSLVVITVNDKGETSADEVSTTVTISAPIPPTPVPPGPQPPVPPGPGPQPPVPPQPPPSPAPIPANGLHVLIVYESAQATEMPAAQQAILYSARVRDHLNTVCVPGPDGRTKQWRIYDKDIDVSAENKVWQDAMNRERKSVPWVVISNHPKGGYEGPLPANVNEFFDLLKKYGG